MMLSCAWILAQLLLIPIVDDVYMDDLEGAVSLVMEFDIPDQRGPSAFSSSEKVLVMGDE